MTESPPKLWRGAGCELCRQTGYRGRAAVYEILCVDEEIMGLMAGNAPIDEIEKVAATRVKPMKPSAAEKVVAGEVTVAEARRALMYLPEY